MLNHQQLYSFNPAYQIQRNYDESTGDIEFKFWGANRTKCYENVSDFTETEFQFQEHNEETFGAYSPPLWKNNASRNTRNESSSSPLLPHNHRFSNLSSPTKRTQAIAEGRKELLEMIQNMPESSYELSLKDMVDERHLLQVKEETIMEERSHSKTEAQIKKQKRKKKKGIKSGQVSRSGSMDNETFLIKIFFPTSLVSKKKATAGKSSKVSPRPSFEGSESHIDKEWWIKRVFVAGKDKNCVKNSSSSTSRRADGNFLPTCWPFFHSKKSKIRRHRGCIS